MKAFLTILFLAFLTPVCAQTKIIPLVDMRHSALLGGVDENGKWVKAEQVIPTLAEQTEFVIAGFKGVEEGGITVGAKLESSEVCGPEYQSFEFDLLVPDGAGVGTAAKWNPVPRVPKEIPATNKEYEKIVGEFLKANGIAKSPVKITQIYRVDLDGDGTEEVVLSATYYKKGIMESQSVGDYSFVLLRKIVGGKARNILVWGEFITKNEELSPPNTYRISALADLNGDGRMEIVADSSYYEGASQTVFEIQNDKAVGVLEIGCGL
jgi:hypothetical protein